MWLTPIVVAILACTRTTDTGARRFAVLLVLVGVVTQVVYPNAYVLVTEMSWGNPISGSGCCSSATSASSGSPGTPRAARGWPRRGSRQAERTAAQGPYARHSGSTGPGRSSSTMLPSRARIRNPSATAFCR